MLQQFRRSLVVESDLYRVINIVNILIHQYLKVMVVLKSVFFCNHLSLLFLTGMICIVVGFDGIEDVILQPNLVLCFS